MKQEDALKIVRNMRADWRHRLRFVPENPSGGGAPTRRICLHCGDPFMTVFNQQKYHQRCAYEVRRQRERNDRRERVDRARAFHERRRILASAMEQILEQQGISFQEFLEGKKDATPALQREPLGKAEDVAPRQPRRNHRRGAKRTAKASHDG